MVDSSQMEIYALHGTVSAPTHNIGSETATKITWSAPDVGRIKTSSDHPSKHQKSTSQTSANMYLTNELVNGDGFGLIIGSGTRQHPTFIRLEAP